MSNFEIGQQVKHPSLPQNKTATVVAAAEPFAGNECVVIEFPALFSDFGAQYLQSDRRTVIAADLTAA